MWIELIAKWSQLAQVSSLDKAPIYTCFSFVMIPHFSWSQYLADMRHWLVCVKLGQYRRQCVTNKIIFGPRFIFTLGFSSVAIGIVENDLVFFHFTHSTDGDKWMLLFLVFEQHFPVTLQHYNSIITLSLRGQSIDSDV